MTVRAYESKHQCKIHVRPHKTKEGIYLYYHSNAEDASAIGLVSQRAVDLLSVEGDSAWDKLMIADCHYIDNTGKQQTCKMLMLSNLEMNTKAYPLISEYVEAIKLAEDNLEQLSYLRPVLDSDGNPVMSSGNFAVVFKMKDERNGKFCALKCFIKDQPGRNEAYKLIADELEFVSSDFIIPIKYLEKELFVDTSNSDVSEFPVLLMDWVEGVTLDKYIREHLHDQYALHLITFQFCRLASWLVSQPFAHGDLKPDNILVKEEGSLVLVDYDGLFVPAMKGQKAREIGSPDYRHPLRTIDDFNEHIDDFSLATIAMQLYAIALQPDLLPATQGDTLLLTETDYRDLGKCPMMSSLLSMVSDAKFAKLFSLFFMAFSENSLSHISFRAFNINKPIKTDDIPLSTKVTDEDIANGVEDEFGAIYSSDGKRLLKGVDNVKPGTQVICDEAFQRCKDLTHINIPNSVTHIGAWTFSMCSGLAVITIPNSVTHIGYGAFYRCSSLTSINIPNSVTRISNKAFSKCSSLTVITIPNRVTYLGHNAFSMCSNLTSINIPNSVTFIGDDAFSNCENLTSITIPDSVRRIGEYAFSGCSNLNHIIIPDSVTHILRGAFYGCQNLTSITIPDSVRRIGEYAFSGCYNLNHITIPNSVTHIGKEVFYGCKRLSSITIPGSVTHIGENAFLRCSTLAEIHIPAGSYDRFKKLLPGCEAKFVEDYNLPLYTL